MARRTPTPGYLDRLRSLVRTRLGRGLAVGLGAAVLFLLVGTVVRQARAYAFLPASLRRGPPRGTQGGFLP